MEFETMDDLYQNLLAGLPSLVHPEEEICGMDSYLGEKVKVASLADLAQFTRIGTDTLVHKAKRDLWRISESSNGQVVIERLFDPSSKEPLKV